jgi:ribonuclease P protein component
MRGPDAYGAALKTRPAARGNMCRIHLQNSTQTVSASTTQAWPKLGTIVAKKLLRTSVRRNEAKRQIRESFRLIAKRLPPGNYLVRIIGVDLSLSEKAWGQLLRAELDRLWDAMLRQKRNEALTK